MSSDLPQHTLFMMLDWAGKMQAARFVSTNCPHFSSCWITSVLFRILCAAVMFLRLATAQAPARDALDWSIGLADRFAKLSNPATSAYALGQLGTLVCQHDRTAGAGIFRRALARVV